MVFKAFCFSFSRIFLPLKSHVQHEKAEQMWVECCGRSIVKGHGALPAPFFERYMLYPNRFHLLFLVPFLPLTSMWNYPWGTLEELHLSWHVYFDYTYFSLTVRYLLRSEIHFKNQLSRGRWEGGSGWGIHVNPWLIHVNVWQKPLQYCKVISLQLIKINEKKSVVCFLV